MFGLNDSKVPIQIIPARKAVRRTVCLATLVMRGEIELSLHDTAEEEINAITQGGHNNLTKKMVAWLENEGVYWDLTPGERELLAQPLGAWSRADIATAVWRQESLAMLLWALGLLDARPPYDQTADQESLLGLVPLNRPTAAFINGATLRPEAGIAEARNEAATWHWRARMFEMELDPVNFPPPGGVPYATIIRMGAEMAEAMGLLTRLGGDFPAHGKPYREMREPDWEILRAIALERHHGLNWLCGLGDNWDSVPTTV